MANNFSSVSFPLEGKQIQFRICYQVVNKSIPSKKRTYSLDFEFKYLENRFAQEGPLFSWPTVQSLSEELQRLVINKVLPLLGKNVHITGLWITAGSNSVHVHLYEFGLGTKNAASPDTSLYFVLQPVTKKISYRFYVKGASLDFLTIPLSDSDKSTIYSFETLFTSVLSLFDGYLLLQYIRNNDLMISSVFKESVKFSKSSFSSSDKKKKPLPIAKKSVSSSSSSSRRPNTNSGLRSK